MTGLHIPSIGAVKSLGNDALSIGAAGIRGLGKVSAFGSLLDKKLQDLGGGSDVLAQLAGLLQAGTPMTNIVDKVATELSKAIARASGKGDDAGAQRTLQRALAGALAPPGTSPPHGSDSATQVATLVQQLKDVLTKLTSELNTAGQKSEFSGAVLDADQAKEIPAQQMKPPTREDSQAATASFVQSLLNRVAGQQNAAPALPDPLARILARAANADVQRGGTPAARMAVPGNTITGATGTATLFQRLIAVIAERGGTQPDGGGKGSHDPAPAQNATPAPQAPSNLPAAASNFQAQIAAAPVSSGHSLYASAGATPYTTLDPQSVIEQVVKGIVLRNSGATSEVRMRLQPEHLGDVSLKLSVTGNTITANIVAQNADVRDMLLSNQQQLARSLSEAGLSLGNFSVDVSGGNAGFNQQRSQQQAKLGRAGFAAALAGEDDTWVDPRFGPPIVSGSSALVLNYLA
jgi:flagellar hook-length control protein FliK